MKFRYLIEVEQTLTDTEQEFLLERYSLATYGLQEMFNDMLPEVEESLAEVLDADGVKFLYVDMMKDGE